MLTQYLDKDGYPMKPEGKPIFLRDEKKAPSMQRVARYIRCTETGMLRWIGHCESCKNFKGHVKYKGVKCSYKIKKVMEEKTKLQKIREQLAEKMTRATIQAIKDGAKYGKQMGGLIIDGVYFPSSFRGDYYGVVLRINAPEIEQLLKLKKEDLEKRAEKLRAELEEIEKQQKSE